MTDQPPGSGHNSNATGLQMHIHRIEALNDERKELVKAINDILDEAEGEGYDKKVMRRLVVLRKMGDAERHRQDPILLAYMKKMGME